MPVSVRPARQLASLGCVILCFDARAANDGAAKSTAQNNLGKIWTVHAVCKRSAKPNPAWPANRRSTRAPRAAPPWPGSSWSTRPGAHSCQARSVLTRARARVFARGLELGEFFGSRAVGLARGLQGAGNAEQIPNNVARKEPGVVTTHALLLPRPAAASTERAPGQLGG
jgi:hypothetical protein